MERYKICGLDVDIDFRGELLRRRSKKYKVSDGEILTPPDMVIDTDFDNLEKRLNDEKNTLPYDSLEYMVTGSMFYHKLLDFNGFMLHSSAVVLDDAAYLFSAPCGTGKSTHTSLWEQYFKEQGAYVINDDKPAIKLEDGKFYVYGTPWSGKSDKNVNARVPLGGICFLERSEENFIEKTDGNTAIGKIVWQTVRPQNMQRMAEFMAILDKLIQSTNVWRMGCKIDYDAVLTAYNAMSGKKAF